MSGCIVNPANGALRVPDKVRQAVKIAAVSAPGLRTVHARSAGRLREGRRRTGAARPGATGKVGANEVSERAG